MKKLLLSALAACTIFGASAAGSLTKDWTVTNNGALEAGKAVFHAPTAIDAQGNLIATAPFTEDITLGGAQLSAVGTSTYVAKYDAAGACKWAVALAGSATVSALTTDEAGNIYLAGTYADEVEIGTTEGTPETIMGQLVDGDPATKENASFIIKYNADGKLLKALTFIPEGLPTLVETGMYFPMDGDVFFHINHLQAQGGKIYASAIYTGKTTAAGLTFEGSYNDPWFGVYYVDLRGVSVFALDTDLANGQAVTTVYHKESLATEEGSYEAGSITFGASEAGVAVTFTTSGPMDIAGAYTGIVGDTNGDGIYDSNDDELGYVYYSIFYPAEGSTVADIQSCPAAGFNTAYVPVSIVFTSDKIKVFGHESFAENYNEDNERISDEIFMLTYSKADFSFEGKKTYEPTDGNINYYALTSVAASSEGIIVTALGYYTASSEEGAEPSYRKGDFAGKAKAFVISDDFTFTAAIEPEAEFAAAGADKVAFSTITETGAAFTVYTDEQAGVDNIAVDSNAPAVYYNLQGMPVENPSNGIYIKRQGNKAQKLFIK